MLAKSIKVITQLKMSRRCIKKAKLAIIDALSGAFLQKCNDASKPKEASMVPTLTPTALTFFKCPSAGHPHLCSTTTTSSTVTVSISFLIIKINCKPIRMHTKPNNINNKSVTSLINLCSVPVCCNLVLKSQLWYGMVCMMTIEHNL